MMEDGGWIHGHATIIKGSHSSFFLTLSDPPSLLLVFFFAIVLSARAGDRALQRREDIRLSCPQLCSLAPPEVASACPTLLALSLFSFSPPPHHPSIHLHLATSSPSLHHQHSTMSFEANTGFLKTDFVMSFVLSLLGLIVLGSMASNSYKTYGSLYFSSLLVP